MLAVFEPLQRPRNDRDEHDRVVGTEAELAAYHAGLAKANAEFDRVWERIEGLIRPEIDQLLAPVDKPKDGKPVKKRTSLSPQAVKAFRIQPAKRSPDQWDLVRQFADKLEVEAPRDRSH